MVTKHHWETIATSRCSVLAKILMVTKQLGSGGVGGSRSVLAKILMVTKLKS